MKTFIVLPCHNEEKNIYKVLKEIDALNITSKIIVVDDGSEDKTYFIVKNNFKEVILLRHKINLGKGAALKTGCDAVIKLGGGVIVLMDTDGQHPPEAIPLIIEKLEKENLDIVFGSRKINVKKVPLVLYIGNKFFTSIINFFWKVSLSDSQSGFKAFRSSIYEKLLWEASDYSVETEMIINVRKNKLKYGEIFIDAIYNDKYKGTTPFDGVNVLFNLIRKKFL